MDLVEKPSVACNTFECMAARSSQKTRSPGQGEEFGKGKQFMSFFHANLPPKFSVVITTYNRKDYLLETIKSVVSQTCQPHEIIVVSDGSMDGTAEAVKAAYMDVILVEQPNLGRSAARNTGVAHATGDWICFLDDDDLWHQSKISV